MGQDQRLTSLMVSGLKQANQGKRTEKNLQEYFSVYCELLGSYLQPSN